jgi:hypothetical protein
VHADFNQDERTGLYARVVFITYLNKDWLASYGGALELWSFEENKCQVEVQPVVGRSVLFLHSPRSLHGLLPDPVNAPNGRPRRSAAAYFYSKECPEGETAGFHTTVFPYRGPLTNAQKLKNAVKYVTPPVLADAVWGTKMFLRQKLIRFHQKR